VTIEEARAAQKAMEIKINDLIQTFQKDTGICVYDFELHKAFMGNGDIFPESVFVRVKTCL